MKQTINFVPSHLTWSSFSFQWVSFIQLGLIAVGAFAVYVFLKKITQIFKSTGFLRKEGFFYTVAKSVIFLLPLVVFIYGVSRLTRQSLFISLLFFVVLTLLITFVFLEPVRAFFSGVFIRLKADLQPGYHIHIFNIAQGRVEKVGFFDLVLKTDSGNFCFIPNHKILTNSFEISSKKEGVSLSIRVRGDFEREHLEKLAYFCPYKKKKSPVILEKLENSYRVQIQVLNLECQPWVEHYFRIATTLS